MSKDLNKGDSHSAMGHKDHQTKFSCISNVLNDIVCMLEIDKTLIKAFNALVIQFLDQQKVNIVIINQERQGHVIGESDQKDDWKKTKKTLNFQMCFMRESLKFLLVSFLKRCRIIIALLVKIKNMFQTDTRESIFVEMLASNMRWSFKTLITCIEKSKRSVEDNASLEGRDEEMQIMQDLFAFEYILDDCYHAIEPINISQDNRKENRQHYDSTLGKLIDKLL